MGGFWHTGRMKKWLVILVGCLLVGCSGGMRIDQEKARDMAVRFLASNPKVEKDNQMYTLHEYYETTDLGKFKNMAPDGDWFKAHQPLVYQTGKETVTVNWVGVPGCELADGTELKLGYEPELVSTNGGSCQVWWSIQVDITNDNPNEMRVRVNSVGTEI